VIAHHLPTLVVVNMTDVLAAREGYLDPLSLAQTLNSPVAMVSAGTGSGMDAVRRFVGVKTASTKTPLLPVIAAPASSSAESAVPRSMSEIENQGL